MTKKHECTEARAQNFQRLILGGLLFSSYLFQYIPIATFVATVMAVSSLFGIRYTPLYQLYTKVLSSKLKMPDTEIKKCIMDKEADRFACGLGFLFLLIGIPLYYTGHATIAWIAVVLVGVLSILAATTGFCLGTAIYLLVFNKGEQS